MAKSSHCAHCGNRLNCPLSEVEGRAAFAVSTVNFRKGTPIYCADMPADYVGLVQHGSVSLTFGDVLGTTRIVRFVQPGEMFGFDSLLPSARRLFMAIARERTAICLATRDTFLDLFMNDSRQAWRLVQVLNALMHAIAVQHLEMSGQPVRERLAAVIARLTGNDPARSSRLPLGTRIRQYELAQLLGVSQETISRELKHLRERDALQPSRRKLIAASA